MPESSAGPVAIVGGGIVGLAHAWSAAKRGHRVTVFERGSRASGASIRNFGMIWPIGQPAGELRSIALRARQAWLELSQQAGLWVHACGSIHLAHRDDEWSVLREFSAKAPAAGYECKLLTREQVLVRTPAANPDSLIGGLFSPTELCVNPRSVLREITSHLTRLGVEFEFNTTVIDVAEGQIVTSTGKHFAAEHVIVCGGADFETLFPDLLRQSGMKLCKLQMLKTISQPAGWKLGAHLASGLTLRHYSNFAICGALTALKQRVATETPELDQYGIHVMASQNDAGEVILGDSHEYDGAIEPFDKPSIDDLMLRELKKVIRLPDWTIAERWHGVYAKHPTRAFFFAEPLPGVMICTGLGGAGMTMAFGVAEHLWTKWT